MISCKMEECETHRIFTVYDKYDKEIFRIRPGNNVLLNDSMLFERLPYLLEKVYELGREDTLVELTLNR